MPYDCRQVRAVGDVEADVEAEGEVKKAGVVPLPLFLPIGDAKYEC